MPGRDDGQGIEVLDEAHPEQATRGSKGQRLRESLVEIIRKLPEGSALPTERELSERSDVARATVRHVLQGLEAEQRIFRRQGKGTFVALAKIEEPLGLTSHTEEMRSAARPGLEADRRSAAARPESTSRLRSASTSARRSSSIETASPRGRRAIALEVLFLNAERFDGITASLGDDVSFYQLLRSDYGVELDSAEETIEAVVAAARSAPARCVPPGRR